MSEQFPRIPTPDQTPDNGVNEYYRILTAEDEPLDIEGLSASREMGHDARLVQLFAPRITQDGRPSREVPDQRDFYYRLIMNQVPEEELIQKRADTERQQEEDEERFIKQPTVDMKLQAFDRLQNAKRDDPYIAAIVEKYIPATAGIPDYDAIVKQVRADADLRYELGSYLLRDKLPRLKRENPHAVSQRVFTGSEKSPARAGYRHLGKLNSQEYTSMLALSMLDGTYEDREHVDPIVINVEKPWNTQGQHRLGAKLLLGPLPNNAQV
jgi:hypothetical protein